MKNLKLDKSFGLFIAGRIILKIGYILNLVAYGLSALTLFIFAGVWRSIPAIVDGTPSMIFGFLTALYIILGLFVLSVLVATAILGSIAIKKVNTVETKKELIPWAIVILILINTVAGVFFLCSRQKVVDDNVIDVQ